MTAHHPGIFITGTNTEVGKTVIGRAIISALARRQIHVAAFKPVESGAERRGEQLVPLDAEALNRATGQPADLSEVCAFAFKDPVSPHLAAARAGQAIETKPIMDLFGRARARAQFVSAEGAGGLLVPLSDHLTYADLIAQLGLPLVIVAPNVLGTINATLLTIEAARHRGIEVAGVILNRTPPEELGNAEAITQHGRVPILGQFPDVRLDDELLARQAEESLDLDKLIGALG